MSNTPLPMSVQGSSSTSLVPNSLNSNNNASYASPGGVGEFPPGGLGLSSSSVGGGRKQSGGGMSNRQVYILKGEISLLITSLRRVTQQRWSSQQDQKPDVPLVKQLQQLKESLNVNLKASIARISQNANYFLVPFLDIIRSEDTSGPVTALALSSIEKFILNDLVNEDNGGTSAAEAITDAVIHAHFVSTDSASDEIVLMKILQVLHRLFMSPLGVLLSNESVCELMQSCFRMCFIDRANELLRKSAETALNDMVRLLFTRVREFPVRKSRFLDPTLELAVEAREGQILGEDGSKEERKDGDQKSAERPQIAISDPVVDVEAGNPLTDDAALRDPELALGPSSNLEVHENDDDNKAVTPENPGSKSIPTINVQHPTPTQTPQQDTTNKNLNPNVVEFKNKRGIRFTTTSDSSLKKIEEVEIAETSTIPPTEDGIILPEPPKVNTPYGIPCVRELIRFLVSLVNPHEKQNTESMIHLGLKLILVAVETDMEAIAMHPALQSIFKNELVKNLIFLLTYTTPSNNGCIILLNVLRILFIIFEQMRFEMKYQLEVFITRLMEIIGDGQQSLATVPVNQNQQNRWIFEQKELALEYLLQLWKQPTLVTELYLNYDCDLFCSNLFEDLTKLLSKNAFPMQTGINSIHLLCLEGLTSILDGIESHCTTRLNSTNVTNTSSSSSSSGASDVSNSSVFYHEYEPGEVKLEKSEEAGHLPTHEQLMAIRHKKKLFHAGSEQFNQNAGKGITFLQTNGVLSTPVDASEVAHFLKENPLLDKKMIGDYISAKKRSDILREFVKSFDFKGTRIDEALRLFLETFRLPGEAPLISHILENFSEVWTEANDNPFVNVDAAYTLSYAVIMLNVDQHNSNVKQQSMTFEQFKKNLKGVNGGSEFDPDMLQEIYTAIKSDEIVMPAEHTGAVKENYMWKMLLRRGTTKSGKYLSPRSDEGLYDHDLFSLSWGPIVAALSFIFDKTSVDTAIITKTITGFRKCATISAHYGMSDVFDNLIISLCKFTTLLSGNAELGSNAKAQNACHTMFQLVHRNGGILREGWKNFIDCLVALFKLQTLPKMLTDAEDFTEPSGRISLVRNTQAVTPRPETGLFSSLYSYIALSTSDNSPGSRSYQDEEELKKKTATLIRECHPELLLSESKFLPLDSLNELVKNLLYASPAPENSLVKRKDYDEDSVIFALEVLIKICIQNRDRVMVFWDPLREHLFSMIVASATCDMQYLLERSTVGLLRLALRLMRKEDICGIVLQSLKILLYLRPSSVINLSQQISFGLHEILKTTAANIHSTEDWTIIFALLEYVGAGKVPTGPVTAVPVDIIPPAKPELVSSDSGVLNASASAKSLPGGLNNLHSHSQDPISVPVSNECSSASDRGYTSDSELEIRSPVASSNEGRTSGVSPAQSWILLAHSNSDTDPASGSMTPTLQPSSPTKPSVKTLMQERQHMNFTPDPKALMKSCETLSFLVRDAAHITPDNFTLCVGAIRSFVDACTIKYNNKSRTVVDGNASSSRKTNRKGKKERGGNNEGMSRSKSFPSQNSNSANAYDADYESDPEADQAAASQHVCIQLLDLLHTLHTRASQIFQWWQKENMFSTTRESIWTLGWKPLLQTIATLCADSRKQIRTTAIAYLQRALLVHDLQQLSPNEWCSCFSEVLFPLMSRLLEPLNPLDPQGMEETRMRASTLLCKVFLQHLTPLMGLESFPNLWLEILSYMEKYLNCDNKRSELLTEAIPESLKNLLLVMDTAGVFHTPDGYTKLWAMTWDKIDSFLPHLRAEMFTVVHPVAQAQGPPQSAPLVPQDSQTNVVHPEQSHPHSQQSSELDSNATATHSTPTPTTNPMMIPNPPASTTPQLHQPTGLRGGGGGIVGPSSPSVSPPPPTTVVYSSSPEYTSICFGDYDEPDTTSIPSPHHHHEVHGNSNQIGNPNPQQLPSSSAGGSSPEQSPTHHGANI